MKNFKKIKLYHYPLSRSMRVAWLLNEMKIPFELKSMKLLEGEGMQPEFLKLNPNHAVPVIEYQIDGEEKENIMLFFFFFFEKISVLFEKLGSKAVQY